MIFGGRIKEGGVHGVGYWRLGEVPYLCLLFGEWSYRVHWLTNVLTRTGWSRPRDTWNGNLKFKDARPSFSNFVLIFWHMIWITLAETFKDRPRCLFCFKSYGQIKHLHEFSVGRSSAGKTMYYVGDNLRMCRRVCSKSRVKLSGHKSKNSAAHPVFSVLPWAV